MALRKKLLAEFLGTTLLLACVVGSGIMGVNLSQGNDAIALLANAGATAGVLYVLIAVLGPISGAHFNPAVTLVMRLRGELRTRDAIAYIGVQVLAAIAGVMLAHAMFDLPLLQPGTHARTGQAQWLSENTSAGAKEYQARFYPNEKSTSGDRRVKSQLNLAVVRQYVAEMQTTSTTAQ